MSIIHILLRTTFYNPSSKKLAVCTGGGANTTGAIGGGGGNCGDLGAWGRRTNLPGVVPVAGFLFMQGTLLLKKIPMADPMRQI